MRKSLAVEVIGSLASYCSMIERSKPRYEWVWRKALSKRSCEVKIRRPNSESRRKSEGRTPNQRPLVSLINWIGPARASTTLQCFSASNFFSNFSTFGRMTNRQ